MKAGDALRVRVQEASAEKLVLKVVETPDAPPAQAPAQLTTLPPLALPDGAVARLFVEPDEEGGGARGAEDRRPDRLPALRLARRSGASTSR